MASCAMILDECRPEPAIVLEAARLNNTGVVRVPCVLQFAEEKNLRAASLEEVAYSAIATN